MSSMENDNEIKKLAKSLRKEIDSLKANLDKFKDDVHKIENGDGKNPYWNGTNAYSCVSKSLEQIDYNKNLVNNLNKCVEYLDSLVK